jgi:hypothetical protein
MHSEPDIISQQGPVHHRNFEDIHVVHASISTLAPCPHRAEKVPAPARLQCRIPEAGEPYQVVATHIKTDPPVQERSPEISANQGDLREGILFLPWDRRSWPKKSARRASARARSQLGEKQDQGSPCLLWCKCSPGGDQGPGTRYSFAVPRLLDTASLTVQIFMRAAAPVRQEGRPAAGLGTSHIPGYAAVSSS